MTKMSFIDKLGVFLEVSKSSYIYIIVLILLLTLGIIFFKTNKKNIKRNKIIYISSSLLIIILLIASYHSSLGKIFDYMMNNFFIIVFFPNLAIYLAAIIATNIILWISIFNFKTSEIIKRINIVIYIIMNYLLALILNVINTNKLDVFTQSSVYGNEDATALIELSSLVFVLWIIFLIIYKIILIYIRKDYKPKVKKIIVKRKVKKLPDNFEAKEVPQYVYGKIKKKAEPVIIREEPVIKEQLIIKEQSQIDEFEKMLTVADYKLLLKMLKEQKEKERIEQLRKEELAKEEDKFLQLQALYKS